MKWKQKTQHQLPTYLYNAVADAAAAVAAVVVVVFAIISVYEMKA